MEKLPAQRWTTYGDLADAVGTAAQPLGQHLATCFDCVNAVQVLTASGKPADNFAWGNPDEDRTPRQVLEQQGIRFGPDGKADDGQKLSVAEIEEQVKGALW